MEKGIDIHNLPALDSKRIQVWNVPLAVVQGQLDWLRSLLSADECKKADRLYWEVDRASSIAARGLLRLLLGGYTGVRASDIVFNYSKNGKPHLMDGMPEFNLSHSAERILLAFGCNRRLGVDVERMDRQRNITALAARCFLPEERAALEKAADPCLCFFQQWARREAYVKAFGSTLFRGFSIAPLPVAAVTERDGWFFYRLEAGPDYAADLVSDQPFEVVRHDFGGTLWRS